MGDLTDLGFAQQVALGGFFRKYLIEDQKLLPRSFDPGLVWVRATFLRRTHESAVAFMQGLYPPTSADETLNITTGQAPYDPLVPYPYLNEIFRERVAAFIDRAEYRSREAESLPVLRPLVDHFGVTLGSDMDFLEVGDHLYALHCNGTPLPDIVTEGIWGHLMKNLAYFISGFILFIKEFAYDPILKLLFEDIDEQYAMRSSARFTLISCHDFTLAAMLSALGVTTEHASPYASHIAMELWHAERPLVRFVLNGHVVQADGRGIVPLSEFRRRFEQRQA
jgi:acid phosphatase